MALHHQYNYFVDKTTRLILFKYWLIQRSGGGSNSGGGSGGSSSSGGGGGSSGRSSNGNSSGGSIGSMYLYIYVLTQPLHYRQDFKWSSTGLNSELSFS